MFSYKFRLGYTGIFIRSDSEIRIFNNNLYRNFIKSSIDTDVSLTFKSIDSLPEIRSEKLGVAEKNLLLTTIGFHHRWLENNYINLPEIAKCLNKPDMCQMEFAWNRIMIRNYDLKKIYYFYSADRQSYFSDEVFHAMYRNILAPFSLLFSMLIIHGAGIILKNKTALFLAPDEGGKTTLVKKFNKKLLLSDDQLCILKEQTKFQVFSTPFGRMSNPLLHGELGGIFWIEKSEKFGLEPCSKRKIFKFIWDEHIHIWMVLPKVMRLEAFNLLNEMINYAPVYRLFVPKNYVDWDAIAAVMK